MTMATAKQIAAEEKATAEDLAAQHFRTPGERSPGIHRMAPAFVRVHRGDESVIHTPGEALPDDVADALDAGSATAGPDGVIVVDLR